jgi:hypothetical protein
VDAALEPPRVFGASREVERIAWKWQARRPCGVEWTLLCDGAAVREGLLEIIAGGVGQVAVPRFAAPLAITLALRPRAATP